MPDMVVTSLSFEDDAVRSDTATSLPAGDPAPSNTRRTLAASVPNDAIFFADASNVGASASAGRRGRATSLAAAGRVAEIEAALGGRLDELFSWIGGGALAAGWDGEQPRGHGPGGHRCRCRHPATAPAAEPAQPGDDGSIGRSRVSTETVAGVEVTSIRFMTTTPTFGSDAGHRGVIQYAMDGERVLIGVGDRFVGRALQLAPGDSLANDARYRAAIDRFGGDDNMGAFFLDLVGLREAVESAAGEMLPPEYTTEVQQYLEPLTSGGRDRVESGDAGPLRAGAPPAIQSCPAACRASTSKRLPRYQPPPPRADRSEAPRIGEREGGAVPPPLPDMGQLMLQLDGLEVSPGEDVAADGDRQPLLEQQAAGATQPGNDVHAVLDLGHAFSVARRARYGALDPAAGPVDRPSASGSDRSCAC